jgi:hypothetical protein
MTDDMNLRALVRKTPMRICYAAVCGGRLWREDAGAAARRKGRRDREPHAGSRSRASPGTFPASLPRYVYGGSTPSVDDLVKATGMSGISKSQVSRLCEQIGDKVKTFLGPPIMGDWLHLWIDAMCVKSAPGWPNCFGRSGLCGRRQRRSALAT